MLVSCIIFFTSYRMVFSFYQLLAVFFEYVMGFINLAPIGMENTLSVGSFVGV